MYEQIFLIYAIVLIFWTNISLVKSVDKQQVFDTPKTKRYYQVPSSFDSKDQNSPSQQQIRDSILERFQINANTIIRTHDSRELGAKYLNETELPSKEDCLYWCWDTNSCNLAVYEEKTRGSCYLFDCGSTQDFKCKFTPHNFYTSSILQTNRHSYDLNQWSSQSQHENELVKLRSKQISSTSIPVTKSSFSPTHTLVAPIDLPLTTSSSLAFIKTPKCKHYQFECRNDSECIAIYNVCDGITQCSDGSDEALDLQCHRSRFNAQTQSPLILQSQNQQKLNDKVFEKPSNSFHVFNSNGQQSQQGLPVYNYPKTVDVDSRMIDDQITSSRKHGNFIPSNNNNNGLRGNWNQQYYQPNDYNSGDSRTGSGYLLDSEYINNNYRDNQIENNQGSSSYWPTIGKQYDVNEPIIQPGQGLIHSRKVNDWSSAGNDQDINYYDNLKKNNHEDGIKSNANPNSFSQNHPKQFDVNPKDIPKNNKPGNQLKHEKDSSQAQLSYLKNGNLISQSDKIIAVSLMHDSNEQSGRETNSAVIALTLGVFITALLVILVGCRMKSIRRKIARRGRSLAHDSDYLINGMYL